MPWGFMGTTWPSPCDHQRRPERTDAIFHEKAGIIEDKAGNRLAFNGSINKTVFGWKHNWDSFHVFTSWGGSSAHVDAEEATIQQLWADKAKSAVVIDIPAALREELLKFLPDQERLPHLLLHEKQDGYGEEPEAQPHIQLIPPEPRGDRRAVVWSFLRLTPSLPGDGERVGEATCPITPWPHQVRAFQRMYEPWQPKLLIADEVGLGKRSKLERAEEIQDWVCEEVLPDIRRHEFHNTEDFVERLFLTLALRSSSCWRTSRRRSSACLLSVIVLRLSRRRRG
jgi:hypothetical protein